MFSVSVQIIRAALTRGKADPSGVGNDVDVPVGRRKQDNGRGHTHAPDEYADERQHPLRRQLRREADLGPFVDREARPHQAEPSCP